MTVSDNVFPIPEGWGWVRVKEVGQLIKGISYPKDEASSAPGDSYYPILRANNIQTLFLRKYTAFLFFSANRGGF